jgi:putative ABC transport system ATP-binding protein
MSLLKLEHVVKRYRLGAETVHAIDGVDLTVAEGELVAVHGPSGSGKTTLLLLIAALLRPDAGQVRYRGRALSALSDGEVSRHLRREVGFVYQNAQLMPRVSALENACVKLLLDGVAPRRARALAEPWLARLGLGERLARTPEQLSGGERQRVAIARALAGSPRLVLADEPTGNLDSRRSLQTVRLLGELAGEQGTAVVLVTHDPEAAALADRRFELRDGRLSEDATPATAPPTAGAPNAASTLDPTGIPDPTGILDPTGISDPTTAPPIAGVPNAASILDPTGIPKPAGTINLTAVSPPSPSPPLPPPLPPSPAAGGREV